MPGIPKIQKFKGDNSQSFKMWILEFEAQCTALGHDKKNWRELLQCNLEGKAFVFLSNLISQSDGKITYNECLPRMEETYS